MDPPGVRLQETLPGSSSMTSTATLSAGPSATPERKGSGNWARATGLGDDVDFEWHEKQDKKGKYGGYAPIYNRIS